MHDKKSLRIALYARVSTRDKNQNPETHNPTQRIFPSQWLGEHSRICGYRQC